jgi:hypothetical protein
LKKVSDILEYDFFQLYDDKNVSDSE